MTKIRKGVNDLATTHPELAKEAHGWDPTTVIAGTATKLNWICVKDHIWETSGDKRVRGTGCPYCANQRVLSGFNDLAASHPELAKEAHGWDPTTVIAGSHKKLEWKCPKNHIWSAVVLDRKQGNNCSVCANKKVLSGFNDLATTHPELAKEAHGWDPTQVIAGTNKKLDWKCEKGHKWKAMGSSRVKGTGCPYCANKKVLSDFNDLATTHPELAKEAHGWDPTKIIAGTHKQMKWKCPQNHIWSAVVLDRKQGNNCSVCANKKVLSGFNDLATTHPELAKEAYGWDPTQVIAGTNKQMKWKCHLGHVWSARSNSRVEGNDCPYCSGHKVLVGFNDLVISHPQLSKEADGWDPTDYSKGSDIKKRWICSNKHKWTASISSRTAGRGCPSCAKTGFDPNKDGYLYFLIQPKWEIYQIGITNIPKDRLNNHKKNGFELLELRGKMDGYAAQELETAILRYLKSQKADLSPEHLAGKFDGYTESWTIDSFKVNNLKELIDKASEAGY